MREVSNRLADEVSPYLLQHAHNPVEWFPWGEEAFEEATRRDRPVFLSIGYSTCHWCHVMERESFEDPEVAALMNDAFVSIKVDREERPDIDGVYMSVAQMLTGSGGWPLTVIMTPDRRPFFAGTYFPKYSQPGRIGMLDLVPRIRELWTERRDDVENSADEITRAVRKPPTAGEEEIGERALEQAYRQLALMFDHDHGGFGTAPKFPTPHNLTFLLRYWQRTGTAEALRMVEHTLRAMRAGGIFDQIGYGFHRYSTDARWLVPHFEKMLYDQALLVIAYAEAYAATGTKEFRHTAEQVLDYVDRELSDPRGAFYSAVDADSEGEEGKFYLWTSGEIDALLPAADAQRVRELFGVEEEGNYRDEATHARTGANVLYRRRPVASIAESAAVSLQEVEVRVEAARAALLAARLERPRPHLDDKVLTDWNGLMIAALAIASIAFDERRHAERAERALDFVLSRLRRPDGRLLHRFRDGDAAIGGNLDDYAFLTWGLIELYEATFEARYLRLAIELAEAQRTLFADDERGAFFFTAAVDEELLVRQRQIYDGAVPSGNSVAALNLLRLGRLCERTDLEARGRAIFEAFAAEVARFPASHTQLMNALDFSLGPTQEVVIAGDPEADDTRALIDTTRRGFHPRRVALLSASGAGSDALAALAPFAARAGPVDGEAAAYVCEDFACRTPVTDPSELRELLAGPSGRAQSVGEDSPT